MLGLSELERTDTLITEKHGKQIANQASLLDKIRALSSLLPFHLGMKHLDNALLSPHLALKKGSLLLDCTNLFK